MESLDSETDISIKKEEPEDPQLNSAWGISFKQEPEDHPDLNQCVESRVQAKMESSDSETDISIKKEEPEDPNHNGQEVTISINAGDDSDVSDGDTESDGDTTLETKGGLYVESLLKVNSSKRVKRHFVSVNELQRRCSGPEKFSANLMVTYLRRAKNKKRQLEKKLTEAGVQLVHRCASNTTMCTKLVEEDCRHLAKDLGHLTKHVRFKDIGEELAKAELAKAESSVHSAVERVDHLSAALDEIHEVLKGHMQTYDTVTHTLGPQVTDVTFGVIKACLRAKKRALEGQETAEH